MNRESAQEHARGAVRETQRAAELLISDSFDRLWRAFELICGTFERGGQIYVCGNGGSAADAQHFVTELVVRLDAKSKRRPLPATSLSTDTSILTAASNDLGFERVFARQLEALCSPSDLVLLISTSGNSRNLLAAAEAARLKLAPTVALLGRGGGALAPLADCAVIVPSDDVQRIQEVHALVLHLWCEWLEPHFTS
jgi:D-sedoheptulose 7-phosphate isomerase